MNALLLRLCAPMQSWGISSRFSERDTGREPSKSGIVGLLGAALGRARCEPPDDLAALRMGVRVDREGTILRDYQTAGGGKWLGAHYGVAKASGATPDTVVSNRYYLADACFLVALAATDEGWLRRLDDALARPRWPLYLGRKAFPPAEPIRLPDGLRKGQGVEEALSTWPWLVGKRPRSDRDRPDALRLILECGPGESGEPRQDVPLSFRPDRRDYGVRYVRETWVSLSELPEGMPCT